MYQVSSVWVGAVAQAHSGYTTGLVPQCGYSHFFFIRRLGPSIYRLPKKILGISGKYLKFLQPQKWPEPTYVSKYPPPPLGLSIVHKVIL